MHAAAAEDTQTVAGHAVVVMEVAAVTHVDNRINKALGNMHCRTAFTEPKGAGR
jgi:hypothetical protein